MSTYPNPHSTVKKKEKIRVALIGHGHLGQFHAQKVSQIEGAILSVVVDANQKSLDAAANLYPDIKTSKSVSAVLDDFDAALVVVPTQYHAEIVAQLIRANKHIFCEKPICATIEELQNLESELEKTNTNLSTPLVFMAGHSERIHQGPHTHKKAAGVVESSDFIQIQRLAPFKGRGIDVDVVSDLMIHDLDLLYYIYNELPCKAFSTGYRWATDKWDYVNSTLFFPSGRKAQLIAHRGYSLEKRQWEFFGQQGYILWDLKNRMFQIWEDPKKLTMIDQINYATQDHLRVEQTQFITSIRDKKDSSVPFKDGALMVTLMNKILNSINHSNVVDLT